MSTNDSAYTVAAPPATAELPGTPWRYQLGLRYWTVYGGEGGTDFVCLADSEAQAAHICAMANTQQKLVAMLQRWLDRNPYTSAPHVLAADTKALLAELLP